MAKVYAIAKGFNNRSGKEVKNKIVQTWDECQELTRGVSGARFKSFANLEEANEYLDKMESELKGTGTDLDDLYLVSEDTSSDMDDMFSSIIGSKIKKEYPKDAVYAYVDGSYNKNIGKYSAGVVLLKDDVIIHIEGAATFEDPDNKTNQIAGELEASIRAVEAAIKLDYKNIVIFHDYLGIANHATGEWKRNSDSAREYYNIMQAYMRRGMNIQFEHVSAHAGHIYNELADEICKNRLGIKSEGVVRKYLKNNKLKVNNISLKRLITLISDGDAANIEIVGVQAVCEKTEPTIEEIRKQVQDLLVSVPDNKIKGVLSYLNKLVS